MPRPSQRSSAAVASVLGHATWLLTAIAAVCAASLEIHRAIEKLVDQRCGCESVDGGSDEDGDSIVHE